MSVGVYKAGFATTQQAYEAAVPPVFNSLDRLEKRLASKDYLVGDRLTEADVRLFVTIVSRPITLHLSAADFRCLGTLRPRLL
jgi:glutathionyl-hydroquinone reductase